MFDKVNRTVTYENYTNNGAGESVILITGGSNITQSFSNIHKRGQGSRPSQALRFGVNSAVYVVSLTTLLYPTPPPPHPLSPILS